MTSSDIRESFLGFFEKKGHRRVPSSPLLPAEDPTLLFTNAGMNQFKLVFTGRESRDYNRAASSQRCVRAGGKHNDLENVGYTARHHTFFEMLGNFSFGDYFKEGAISFAYDLLVREWKMDPARLLFTVFSGEGGIPADDEARSLWKKIAGVGDDRVLGLGMQDNFWAMGDTGPCGPCSEIHYHLGDDIACAEESAGRKCKGVACDCDRWMEIWNLVFMQYERSGEGVLTPLPAPSIDTGMGLERVTAVLQGKRSNYDTDLFQRIIAEIGSRMNRTYGQEETTDVSLRVVADHLRAAAFLIADGIYPSNEGRGYVLRRIMRRMIRHVRLMGSHEPVAFTLVPVLVELMGQAHPVLEERAAIITQAIRREEETFLVTLDRGLLLLDEAIASLKEKTIPGSIVFKLYDTYGFPPDLTALLARDRNLAIDQPGFDAEMAAQRDRSRKASSFEAAAEIDTDVETPTEFVGYEELRADARVLTVFPEANGKHCVVLDRSPFYAESGGQVGDQGLISGGTARFQVEGTIKNSRGVYFHTGVFESGMLDVGALVRAEVNRGARVATERHHTGTHLLHAALHEVLGDHVRQAGSLVTPDRLRFDFAHFQAMTPEEIRKVEEIANAAVLADLDVTKRVYPIEEAKKMGAKMFFGDKYGELVRVVSIEGRSDYGESSSAAREVASREFCGGTHVRRSGEIGIIRILSESAISAGVRRMEAVAGTKALEHVVRHEEILHTVGARLTSTVAELPERLERVLDERKKLQKELARARAEKAMREADEAVKGFQDLGGVRLGAAFIEDIDRTAMRLVGDKLLQSIGSGVIIVGSNPADDEGRRKAALCVLVSKDRTNIVKAGDIVARLAKICGGGGGGRPEIAEAGGKDAAKVPEAIDAAAGIVKELMKA
ncbi:MAG: alanine--tRNA ligase [Candidatus Hydrogenedentota bacterium]